MTIRADTSHRFPSVLPIEGERVLCLAPPGEIAEVAALCVERAGRTGRVVALMRGDPYLQGPLPAGLDVHEGDPGRPHRAVGPFDSVLAWGSAPFLSGFPPFLTPVRDALRPGGRLELDLPAYGFNPTLQACDPRAADWFLPNTAGVVEALGETGFRDVNAGVHVELRAFDTLAEMIDDRTRPFPLTFESEAGLQLAETLRNNLAAVFEGAEELSLALRRVRASARR